MHMHLSYKVQKYTYIYKIYIFVLYIEHPLVYCHAKFVM